MKSIVFAIKDLAVEGFQQPQTVQHIGGAVRWFGEQINNREAVFGKHPEDYEMYELAMFDDADGSFTLLAEPRLVARGKDLLRLAN